jgi:hypothetical protein
MRDRNIDANTEIDALMAMLGNGPKSWRDGDAVEAILAAQKQHGAKPVAVIPLPDRSGEKIP